MIWRRDLCVDYLLFLFLCFAFLSCTPSFYSVPGLGCTDKELSTVIMDVEQSAGTFVDDTDKKKQESPSVEEDRSIEHGENDLLGLDQVDEVLAAKMALINDVSSCELSSQWQT